MPYELGADGSNGKIDCIHLVYHALEDIGVPTPAFNPAWYTASTKSVLRDLLRWGYRVDRPTYDGEVILLPQDRWAFAAVWNQGILHINKLNNKVAWCPLSALSNAPCFHTKSS